MQGDADEEGSRAAAGNIDAFRLRVFRPRPDGPEHGEQTDGDGEQKIFLIVLSHMVFPGAGGGGEAVQEAREAKDGQDVRLAAFGDYFPPLISPYNHQTPSKLLMMS